MNFKKKKNKMIEKEGLNGNVGLSEGMSGRRRNLVFKILKSSPFLLMLHTSLFADTVSIVDFGLKPNTEQNATPLVRKALESIKLRGGGTLFFPKGIYHFYEDGALISHDGPYVSNNQDDFPKWTAMPIVAMKNLTIDGSGSLFLMHHRMTVFHIKKSKDVIIKNVAFDFVCPIHTDSQILKKGNKHFTLRFARGTRYRIDKDGRFRFFIDGELKKDWGGYVFEGKTGRTKYKKHNFPLLLHRLKAREVSPGVVEFAGKVPLPYQVGDRITHRHNNRNHVGIFIEESDRTQLKNVTIHHACGMGVVGQRSTDITIDALKVIPRKETGRISTTMADATHFSGCRGMVSVTNSHFQGMMDDAINVHGTSLRIIKINREKNTIVARFMHDQSKGFTFASPGDLLRLIDNETLLPVAKGGYMVQSIEKLNVHEVKIKLERPLPSELKLKHAIENITFTPEVIFARNTVINNRARGALFNTPRRCVIKKNYIRTSGSAILIAGDANGWFESGAVGEWGPVVIAENTFEDCLTNMFQFCRAIISIDPAIKKIQPTHSYHRNIIIQKNRFKVFDAPLVFARSVDGLKIFENVFERTHTFQPWHPNTNAFLFEGCQHVILKKNKRKGNLLSTKIQLLKMNPKELILGKSSPFHLESK